MNRTELTEALAAHGMDRREIKDLFLFYLTTEERQAEMLDWLKGQDGCGRDAILAEAQRILKAFLNTNPYNAVPKDVPIPKWQPDKEEPAPERQEREPFSAEDPFDRVLQAFFSEH